MRLSSARAGSTAGLRSRHPTAPGARRYKIHTRHVSLAPGVDLGDVAGATAGCVGADLRNIVNEAALIAARKGKNAVSRDDLDEAIERSPLGYDHAALQRGDGRDSR